jgi:hypothetical protein
MTNKKTREVLLRITYDTEQRFADKWGSEKLMRIADPIGWNYQQLLIEKDEGADVTVEVFDPTKEPVARSLDQVRLLCETLSIDDGDEPEDEKSWHEGYRRALQDVLHWINNPDVVLTKVAFGGECANCFDIVYDGGNFGLYHSTSGHLLCDPNDPENSSRAEIQKADNDE